MADSALAFSNPMARSWRRTRADKKHNQPDAAPSALGQAGERMVSTDTHAPSREDFAALVDESYGQNEAFEGSVVKGLVVAIESGFTVDLDGADEWDTELRLRVEPGRIERIARPPQTGEDSQKILPDEMRQHGTIVQRGAPTHEIAIQRFLPKPGDERPQPI